MLKTTKKQLRKYKKKRETRKRGFNKKSKTFKKSQHKKPTNLKNKTLKKYKGGAPPSRSTAEAFQDGKLGELHSKLAETSELIEGARGAMQTLTEQEEHNELLASLSGPAQPTVKTAQTLDEPFSMDEDDVVTIKPEEISKEPYRGPLSTAVVPNIEQDKPVANEEPSNPLLPKQVIQTKPEENIEMTEISSTAGVEQPNIQETAFGENILGILTSEFPEEPVLVEKVKDVLEEEPEIIEKDEEFPVDEVVELVAPTVSNKKTLKERLSSTISKIKQRFTRKRRPLARPPPGTISNPTFIGTIASPSGEIAAQSGEIVAPSGEIAAPSGEIVAPSGEIAAPSGEIAAPSGEIAAPSGEIAAPSGEIAAPSGEIVAQSGEIAAQSGEIVAQSGEIAAPSGEIVAPSSSLSEEYEMIEMSEINEEPSELEEDETPEEVREELDTTLTVLDEDVRSEFIDAVGDTLSIPEPTPEKVETELNKPEKVGMLVKIKNAIKKVLSKMVLKDKKSELKNSIKEKLETKYPELNSQLEQFNVNMDNIYQSIVENRDKTQRIIDRFNLVSSIKDEQLAIKISKMLDELRKEIITDTFNVITEENAHQYEILKNKIDELTRENATFKSNLVAFTSEQSNAAVNRITSEIEDMYIKKLAAASASNKTSELASGVTDPEIIKKLNELTAQVQEYSQQNMLLRELIESKEAEPFVYISEKKPVAAEKQPVAAEKQPVAAEKQPVAAEKQPVAAEQVIQISPEQLLDNKTIVIKIMMPRGAQIDTLSNVGNTVHEQMAQYSTTETVNKQEAPPPYSEKGGNKTIDPSVTHPATLF
jgi:hypothetical protein